MILFAFIFLLTGISMMALLGYMKSILDENNYKYYRIEEFSNLSNFKKLIKKEKDSKLKKHYIRIYRLVIISVLLIPVEIILFIIYKHW